MTRRHVFFVGAAVLFAAQALGAQTLSFSVLLDGQQIGQHRFVVLPAREGIRQVRSEADFQVRLLGVPVYRYQHRAEEQWRDDCLQAMQSSTVDGGESSTVDARMVQGRLEIQTGRGTQDTDGCLMSFAYWNPAIQRQQRLLNAQTGRIEQVRLTLVANAQIEVQGQMIDAQRWRLSGTERPLDVWWTKDGRWVGLDATVSGGRVLQYRLR